MSESGVSYAGAEPPVSLTLEVPADLYAIMVGYAPIQAGGDMQRLAIMGLRRQFDPDEARRLEMVAEEARRA